MKDDCVLTQKIANDMNRVSRSPDSFDYARTVTKWGGKANERAYSKIRQCID